METRFAVILPAYNEALTISQAIDEFCRELPDCKIVVVDNNSSDNTAEIAEAALKRTGRGYVIREQRQGKGYAVRRGFQSVTAEVYILADADTTYPASAVHSLIKPIINDEADMVVGDRHTEGKYRQENKRSFHVFGNCLVRFLVNRLFSAELRDIMSGYRAMSHKFVKSYPILVSGFQLETDMTLHALDKRFRILELPVDYRDRPSNSFSKLNTVSDGMRVLFTIAQILRYYKPLFFFGSLAVAFVITGLLSAIPVIEDWIKHKYIYHVPLAILAASFEIVSLVLLSIGLTLDSIAHQARMSFELQITRNYSQHND